MALRASLSISEPNEEWIQSQLASKKFASRSDVVNHLIGKAREIEIIRVRLIASEESIKTHGYVTDSAEEILAGIKGKTSTDAAL